MSFAVATLKRPHRPAAASANFSKPRRRTAVDADPRRAARLLKLKIDFIPNPSFLLEDAEFAFEQEDESSIANARQVDTPPRELPGHLARLCESALLTAEEEARLFRRMNFAKYKAHSLRRQLDYDRPNGKTMDHIELYLAEAAAIRDRIVKANMRLVMSIVKKFVTPQHSFDDLLSDGIFSLMHAVEKFDYDRGFRFSTYAYRAIARNAYRAIADRQKESDRFAGNSEDVIVNAEDESGSSSIADEAWERLRSLLAQMMDRLDRREQFIMRSRYALGAHRKVRSLRYLAERLGVSKERARQLEQRALGKLQRFAQEHQFDDAIALALG